MIKMFDNAIRRSPKPFFYRDNRIVNREFFCECGKPKAKRARMCHDCNLLYKAVMRGGDNQ